MKRILLCIFTVLFTFQAMADMISGTVLDKNNEPLIGAAITPVETTGVGTTTDSYGKFTATNFPTGAEIEISYLGYKKQTLPASADMGTIILQEDAQQLDEVVVHGTTVKQCTPQTGEKDVVKELKTQNCYPVECASARYKLTNTKSAFRNDKIITFTQNDTDVCPDANSCTQITVGEKCEDQDGRDCKSTAANVKTAKYKWENNRLNCIIKKCNDGFIPNDAGTACEASEGPCSVAQIKAIEHATKGELKKGVCHATECDAGFEVNKGKCIAIAGNCNPMPENAKSAHREYNAEQNKEICIIDECKDGFNISDDKSSCTEKPQPKLSKEDSDKKIAELRENAEKMKAKEQSIENKLIGAAGIGATGIGGMQLASAMAEQNADADAERDMAAYLATFKCDFGQGRNIQGGESNIELPGGNQLLPLYTEYTQLASDLKIRKQALGMTPGIESETILDKANTGLYDNESLGKTSGAYASLARALTDETSADAAAWAEQKSDTASQLKTGATVAGIGAAGSLIANLAVNSGKAKQNKSDEINTRYEALKTLETEIATLPSQESGAQCPTGATGTYPNCLCTNNKMVYNNNANTCDNCSGDKIARDGLCSCPDGTVPGDNDKCNPSTVAPKCDTTDANIKVDPTTGVCSCVNGYALTENGKNCECPSATHQVGNGLCVKKPQKKITEIIENPVAILTPPQAPEKIILPTNNLFALGKSTLTTGAIQAIARFAGQVQATVGTDTAYCINVVGHTDKTGTKELNNKLSLERANAVKTSLVQNGLAADNITATGRADSECALSGNQQNCRKVEISFSDNKCST